MLDGMTPHKIALVDPRFSIHRRWSQRSLHMAAHPLPWQHRRGL